MLAERNAACVNLFNPENNTPGRGHYYLHFTAKNMEAQGLLSGHTVGK